MRNERENKPVKVEMVANKKGVVVPKTRSRPSSYIPNNDENDDIWLSDDLSYSAYPREPPNFAYNIVPPLHESPSLASLPSNRQNLLNEGLSLSPTIIRHGLKRREQNNGEISKKLKLNKVTKSKIPIFKRNKQKKRVTVTPTVQQEINEPAAVSAPLRNSPPIPLTVSKRENDSDDFNVVKRIKKHDKARDKELLENDRELRRKEALRIDKKRKFIQRKNEIIKQKVPLDYYEIQRLNQLSKPPGKNIKRNGISPPRPISRGVFKRKIEDNEGDDQIALKRYRKPVSKKASEQAAKLWMQRIKIRNLKNKWANRKPTQSDINKFKPKLW
ncbi:unnamed protein product [Meloidogyne enterolobii]|uniref:Uncharacterized protein n=1 Tax=Meloidogyne enterolobii TaxID=390850 RepID=A0ACB0YG32_MELEN